MNSITRKAFLSFACLVLAVVLTTTSCAKDKTGASRKERQAGALRQEVIDCMPPEGEAVSTDVAEHYENLANEGNREAVRNSYAIGATAIPAGRWAEATRVLDGAVARLEGSSVGDRSAKKARSTFHKESVKNFRGEPYEQAMIYLLRGLAYMQTGDYENARAMFRSGALADQSSLDAAPEEQYSADLAEMDYLEALCNLKLNDNKAEDCLRRAGLHSRTPGAVLDPPPDFNTVVLVLSGTGPSKYREGRYGEYLRFSPGNGRGGPIEVSADGAPVAESPGPLDNMTFQATTRGGRVIDGILKGKAVFKTTTAVAGDAAIIAGTAVAMSDRDNIGIGLGIAAVGVATRLASAAATPEADVRELQPMPDDIYVIPVSLAAGTHSLTVNGGRDVCSVEARPNGCEIVLFWNIY